MATLTLLLFFVSIFLVVAYRVDPRCECGVSQVGESRIVGGREAFPHQYPWMVAIYNGNEFHCGGTLINNLYVITAGHCVRWTKQENMHVVLGMHSTSVSQGVGLRVAHVILYPGFYSHKYYDENDIALIRLEHPVFYDHASVPICLPRPGELYYNKFAMITGWGRVGEVEKLSNTLKYAFIKILTPFECANTTMGPFMNDNVFCAYNHYTDACQGDSGGPLLFERYPGKTELIGVVSWGKGCANLNTPGIYTKVANYIDWIYANTQDATYCTDDNSNFNYYE